MAASWPQQPSRSSCSARQHGNAVWTCKPALRGSVPIICPTLIIEAEHDFAGGGGQTLIDALTAPAQLVQLTEHQGLMAIAAVSARRSGQRSSTTGFGTPFYMTGPQ